MSGRKTIKITGSKNEQPKQNIKAFFFLRHNNDIDHITPVLYKWLTTENVQTDVIIPTSRDLLNDFRINFLKQYKNANIYYLGDLFKKYSLEYLFIRIYPKYDTQLDNVFKKIPFTEKIANRIINRIIEKIFGDAKNSMVVFDWTTTYFVEQIVKFVKKRGAVTISLPHGDWPYDSLLMTINDLNYDCLNSLKSLDIFDYVVIPNFICYPRHEYCIAKEKIKVLGCPRYSDEWMEIISKLIPSFKVEKSNDKLKIIFFLRNTCYPIFWEEVIRTIKLILQFSNVYLIVKHHPRSGDVRIFTKKLIDLYPEVEQNIDKNLKFIYDDVNSTSLLKWADLVVDIGTSIAFGAIKEGKPVIMPEYLHANYSTIAHLIKSSELRCRDDLYNTIEKFVKNKKTKVYSEKEREKFIKEVINVPDRYVLERYSGFLKKCLNEQIEKK